MRIVAISDTHALHKTMDDLPDGDVLVHAGDFMNSGYDPEDVRSFNFSESGHQEALQCKRFRSLPRTIRAFVDPNVRDGTRRSTAWLFLPITCF